MRTFAPLLLTLVILTGCASTPEPPTAPEDAGADRENVAARVDRALERLAPRLRIAGEPVSYATLADRMEELRIPGVSLAYMVDGDLVYTRQEGLRDVEGGLPVTERTVFQAGSVSKPVAMMVLLSLVDEGRLSLDEDVHAYLRSWRVPAHAWPEEPVTLRRLASHGAGTTVNGFPGYAAGEAVPTTVQVLRGEGNTSAVVVDRRPGEGYRYSGGGTTIAQLVMEDLTGKPLPEIAAEHLFDPLAMERSSFAQPLAEALRNDSSQGYRVAGEAVEGGPHTYPEMAAAGLWTTPSDLLRLISAVQSIHLGDEEAAFASKALIDEALTFQNERLGIGFFLTGEPGAVTAFGHGGADEGFRAYLDAKTDGSDALAIMINSDNGSELGQQIRAAIAEEFDWSIFRPEVREVVDLSADELSRLEGIYSPVGDPETRIRIFSEDGGLVFAIGEDERRPFRPLSNLEFFYVDDSRLVFEIEDTGRAAGFSWLGIHAERVR